MPPAVRRAEPTGPVEDGRAHGAGRGVGHRITRLASGGRQRVAGTYYHCAAIRKVVGRRTIAPVGSRRAGLRTPAHLVRDPGNRYDTDAVAVQVPRGGSAVVIGFLPREVAPRWQPLLLDLERRGRVAECQAVIHRAGAGFQVVLHLAPPEHALLAEEPGG